MLSTQEREHKRGMIAKTFRQSGTDVKKYDELYIQFCHDGYSKDLAELFADTFVNEPKKPAPDDIIQTAQLFDRVHDLSSAEFYLDMLKDKKLGNDDKFSYCVEMLKNKSKQGHWRDAEDFRTENINFMQNYSEKVDIKQRADMYIALALVDCAAKHYTQAFKLLTGFGYKPQGKNDTKLIEIVITGVYICAKSGDEGSLENAVNNAHSALKLFSDYEYYWTKAYYEKCIEEAAKGII